MTTMVSIRRNNSNISSNNVGHSLSSRLTFYAAVLAIFVLTAILLNISASPKATSDEEVSPQKVMMNTVAKSAVTASGDFERDEEGGDLLKITQGSVTYTAVKTGTKNDPQQPKSLEYYHCGPIPTKSNPQLSELVLLHGAAFTKEDWKLSGILDKFCDINNNEDEGDLSITAWDLPVSADGNELIAAYNAMVNEKRLSGSPVTFVTPSASGKSLASLGEIVHEQDAHQELKLLVKCWIPVASGAVLKTSDEALLEFVHAGIPILSIHGDQDAKGKEVSERLVKLTSARGIELGKSTPLNIDHISFLLLTQKCVI